jgi:hypothetical protein
MGFMDLCHVLHGSFSLDFCTFEEMFSPFIEAAVDSMKRFVVDQTALQAFSTLIQGDSI